jgi:hypothetical protein
MIDPDRILAVCGFPRSGTTLTMRMLYAAGVPVMADSLISFEVLANPVVDEERDLAWWYSCRGKAVKLLEPHRMALPRVVPFNFVWCQRDFREQARSNRKVLQSWNGLHTPASALSGMMRGLQRDTFAVQAGLQEHWPEGKFCVLQFEQTLSQPRETARQLCLWAGVEPDDARVDLMAAQVLPRGPGCYPGMLEEMLVEPKNQKQRNQ